MIKVFTNDFRCDMMKKATGLQKGSRCLFLIFYAKDVFIRRKTYPYNKDYIDTCHVYKITLSQVTGKNHFKGV